MVCFHSIESAIRPNKTLMAFYLGQIEGNNDLIRKSDHDSIAMENLSVSATQSNKNSGYKTDLEKNLGQIDLEHDSKEESNAKLFQGNTHFIEENELNLSSRNSNKQKKSHKTTYFCGWVGVIYIVLLFSSTFLFQYFMEAKTDIGGMYYNLIAFSWVQFD